MKPGHLHTLAVAPLAAALRLCDPLSRRVADRQALNAGCRLTGPWTLRAGRDLGDHGMMRLVSPAGMPASGLL